MEKVVGKGVPLDGNVESGTSVEKGLAVSEVILVLGLASSGEPRTLMIGLPDRMGKYITNV